MKTSQSRTQALSARILPFPKLYCKTEKKEREETLPYSIIFSIRSKHCRQVPEKA